jgi:predicted DNA binding protein
MQQFLDERDDVRRSTLLHARVVDDHERLLFRVEGRREPYVSALAGVESVVDFDVTDAAGEAFSVYVVQRTREADRLFRAALDAESLLLVPPVVYEPGGVMRCTVVGEPADLRGVLEGMPEDVAVDVVHVGEYAGPRPAPGSLLTDRQREAAAAAVDAGYYAVPREASLSAVADRLGLAESTVSAHLRKAEARVLRWLLGRDDGGA